MRKLAHTLILLNPVMLFACIGLAHTLGSIYLLPALAYIILSSLFLYLQEKRASVIYIHEEKLLEQTHTFLGEDQYAEYWQDKVSGEIIQRLFAS